ncbi:MAG TPA: VOC family protein [Alphaproteobacteria bacterium]|nr:VOC family protein [Alphaproteobacteria bacterium]
MLDHLSIGVSDFARAAAFYDACLAPLGGRRVMEFGESIGYGTDYPSFWVGRVEGAGRAAIPGLHICLQAPDRAAVDAFHAAALWAGGRDDGAPGLRPHYHATYYAAFVLDPDGTRIEAVCHRPE